MFSVIKYNKDTNKIKSKSKTKIKNGGGQLVILQTLGTDERSSRTPKRTLVTRKNDFFF